MLHLIFSKYSKTLNYFTILNLDSQILKTIRNHQALNYSKKTFPNDFYLLTILKAYQIFYPLKPQHTSRIFLQFFSQKQ